MKVDAKNKANKLYTQWYAEIAKFLSIFEVDDLGKLNKEFSFSFTKEKTMEARINDGYISLNLIISPISSSGFVYNKREREIELKHFTEETMMFLSENFDKIISVFKKLQKEEEDKWTSMIDAASKKELDSI